MKTKTLLFILIYCLPKVNNGLWGDNPNDEGYADQYGDKATSIESRCQQVNNFL